MDGLNDVVLEPGEELLFTFKSSYKVHIRNLFWYCILATFLSGIWITMIYGSVEGVNYYPYILMSLVMVILSFDVLRRGTTFGITNKRVLIERKVFSFYSLDYYWYKDMSAPYSFAGMGTFLGYDNIHLFGKGFWSGKRILAGLEKKDAEKAFALILAHIDPKEWLEEVEYYEE